MSFAIREANGLGRLSKDDFIISNYDSKDSIMMSAENQGAMKMAQNESVHKRSKHIEVQYHFIQHNAQTGNVTLENIPTDEQVAGSMTKLLTGPKHANFTAAMGMSVQ